MPKILTKEDIQDFLGIGRDKTRNLFKLKGFPVIYLNNKAVVLEDDFLEWLREIGGRRLFYKVIESLLSGTESRL